MHYNIFLEPKNSILLDHHTHLNLSVEITCSYWDFAGVTSKYLLLFIVTLMLFCLPHNFSCSDSTLTVRNLLSALQNVAEWRWLGVWLDVPKSRRDVMSGKESMLEEWLQNHPAPSWKLVAWALYKRGDGQVTGVVTEHNVLKQLYGKHVTGM